MVDTHQYTAEHVPSTLCQQGYVSVFLYSGYYLWTNVMSVSSQILDLTLISQSTSKMVPDQAVSMAILGAKGHNQNGRAHVRKSVGHAHKPPKT